MYITGYSPVFIYTHPTPPHPSCPRLCGGGGRAVGGWVDGLGKARERGIDSSSRHAMPPPPPPLNARPSRLRSPTPRPPARARTPPHPLTLVLPWHPGGWEEGAHGQGARQKNVHGPNIQHTRIISSPSPSCVLAWVGGRSRGLTLRQPPVRHGGSGQKKAWMERVCFLWCVRVSGVGGRTNHKGPGQWHQ